MTEEIQQTQPQVPSLSLQDLILALQTIQVVAQRGAIRADEMAAVGGLHDRLSAFLSAQGALQQSAPAPATEETSEESAGETQGE